LAEERPAVFNEQLAMSLRIYGALLSDAGRQEEAAVANEEWASMQK
jgi:hypothetical protein